SSIVLIPLLIIRINDASFIQLGLLKLLLIARLLRFFKWVNGIEQYGLIFSTLYKLIPLFISLLGVLSVAFYFYTTLGEVIFGGYIRTDLNINFQLYGDPNYYVYVNFNDFFMGFFTCFHLLVVNNWLYTVSIH